MPKYFSIALCLTILSTFVYSQGVRQFTAEQLQQAEFNSDSTLSYFETITTSVKNHNNIETHELFDGKYGEIYHCNNKPIVLKNGVNKVGTYKCQRVDTTKHYNEKLQFTHYEIHNSFGGINHIVWFEYHENGALKETFDTDAGATYFKSYHKAFNTEGQLVYQIDVMDRNSGENSLHTIFYEDGKVFSKAHFYKKKFNGLVTYYYNNGQLKNEYNYVEGKLHGLETDYLEDGSVWRQIEHKNGKIVKLTINSADEIADESMIENGSGKLYNFNNDMELCSIEIIKNGKVKKSKSLKECPCLNCEFDSGS